MKAIGRILVFAFLASVAIAQSSEPPLSETRLTVNTLVREDIFAGFLANDMERFARGEKNIQLLLEQRPTSKPELLAWRAGTHLYRAVLAHEKGRAAEFKEKYKAALDDFAQAKTLGPGSGGVAAITGGSYVFFADRLPKEYQDAAWRESYASYKILWQQQASAVDKLPVHLRGELLGGLAQSALRSGHTEEAGQYLDKIVQLMPNTPYEPVAVELKKNPAAAVKNSVTCMTCHDAGRLAPRMASLSKSSGD